MVQPKPLVQGVGESVAVSDGHYFSNGEGRLWSVRRLHEAAEGMEASWRDVDSFSEWKEAVWGRVTLQDFCDHWRRVEDADLTYPILLTPDGWIMDGCHRLVRAKMLGHKRIQVIQFTELPEPDAYG